MKLYTSKLSGKKSSIYCVKVRCFITANVIKFIIKPACHNTEMTIKFKVYSAIYSTNKSLIVPVKFLR